MTQKLWFLFLTSVLYLSVSAQAVKPDPHFGNNGIISFSVDRIPFETEFPVSLAVQQSNKLLVAATAIDAEGYTGRATVHRFFQMVLLTVHSPMVNCKPAGGVVLILPVCRYSQTGK